MRRSRSGRRSSGARASRSSEGDGRRESRGRAVKRARLSPSARVRTGLPQAGRAGIELGGYFGQLGRPCGAAPHGFSSVADPLNLWGSPAPT
jgi:hypothetical protein